MAINKITGNILSDNLTRGANLAIQTNLIYFDVINTRVGIKNTSPTVELDVLGNIKANNLQATNSVSAVTGIFSGNVSVTGNVSVGNIVVGNTVLGNSITVGNIVGNNSLTLSTVGNANITFATGTGQILSTTTSGFLMPVGNTAQRPGTVAAGTMRFNTDFNRVEVYDGTEWDSVVSGVTNQTLNGDGSTTVFTLDRSSTTAATLVGLNGVVQLPTTAYSVSGNSITFTQAPQVSDTIDIRFL
jgi:hypothetical protein